MEKIEQKLELSPEEQKERAVNKTVEDLGLLAGNIVEKKGWYHNDQETENNVVAHEENYVEIALWFDTEENLKEAEKVLKEKHYHAAINSEEGGNYLDIQYSL